MILAMQIISIFAYIAAFFLLIATVVVATTSFRR